MCPNCFICYYLMNTLPRKLKELQYVDQVITFSDFDKTILQETIEGKKRIGRQSKRCTDNIKTVNRSHR
uniref:Uncharacterized protein n=1 Tax=Arion vulgaris TaxID=1028688 RepID=A0A0B6ZQ22_9EUPU